MLGNHQESSRRYAFTSPYGGCPTSRAYEACGGLPAWTRKVKSERHLRKLLRSDGQRPDLLIMNNFIVERFGVEAICREVECDLVHTEDGFLPHYGYIHLDPVGFCWESSLSRMTFRACTPILAATQVRQRLA